MPMPARSGSDTSRALAWIHRMAEQLAESKTPWAHGTIYRDRRYPSLGDLNLVRVSRPPAMSPDELYELAEGEFGPAAHRRLDFDSATDAEPFSEHFRRHGYLVARLTWMHFEGDHAHQPRDPRVREVDYDTVDPLRWAWHREDFGDNDPTEYQQQAKAVRTLLGTRTLAIFAGAEPIAFAGLDLGEDGAEIGGLYALPEHRGRGLGTALARTAIAGLEAEHLWICADEDDRPKHLYARLGFRPVLTTGLFFRLG